MVRISSPCSIELDFARSGSSSFGQLLGHAPVSETSQSADAVEQTVQTAIAATKAIAFFIVTPPTRTREPQLIDEVGVSFQAFHSKTARRRQASSLGPAAWSCKFSAMGRSVNFGCELLVFVEAGKFSDFDYLINWDPNHFARSPVIKGTISHQKITLSQPLDLGIILEAVAFRHPWR
jgi:hypothetical protein